MSITTELKDFQVETVNWMIDHEKKYNGGMLLNEAGIGKSICVLATIINGLNSGENSLKTLIICPAGIIDHWYNEIQKHTNISKLNVLKYYGPGRQKYNEIFGQQLIYITSYSIISREFNKEVFDENCLVNKLEFGRIILDEAHYIRNPTSNVYKSIVYLGDICTVKKWVVTATPIFNRPNDAFAYFKFLQFEGIDTKSDWTKAITKNLTGIELLNKWFKKYGIALKKEKVLRFDLKNKNEHKIILQFNKIESEFYNALKEYSQTRMKALVKRMSKLDKNAFNKDCLKKLFHSNIMIYILRLKQACNSPWLILNRMERLKGVYNMEKAIEVLKYFNESKNIEEEECPICYDTIADYIADPCGHKCCKNCWNKMQNMGMFNCPRCRSYVNDILPLTECQTKISTLSVTSLHDDEIDIKELKNTSKIQCIIELTKKVTQKKEKIVIVSQWVGMLDIIRDTFDNELKHIKYISLQGNVNMQVRTELIKNFEEDDNIHVCFISLMSSAEGISLISANHLVLVDSWWNNSKTIQVCDRIHRIGQKNQVNIYNLQIENSIEKQIEKLVKKKSKITNLVINKWNINHSTYDSSWMNDIIKLIDTPSEEQTTTT